MSPLNYVPPGGPTVDLNSQGPLGPQGAAGDFPTGPVEHFGAANNYGVPSLPQHLAYNLDRVVTTAPTLEAHPDLAHAAVIAGGDIERNARALAGMQMFHEAIQHARDDQVTHHNVEFQMRGYKEIQDKQRYKEELVARIRYMIAHPKDFPNGTWEEEEALRKVTPFGDPLYQYSPVVATQQQKDMQAFQGGSEQAGINSEQQGMTLEQTLVTQAAQKLGAEVPAGTFGNTEAGTGPQGSQGAQGQQIAATAKEQPESLWQNITGAGVDTWHDIVNAWHGTYDAYQTLNSDVIGRGGVHEPLWVKLIADTTVSTAETLRHSLAGVPGAVGRAATHFSDFVASADDPNQIHPVGPSTPAEIPVAAISQGLFGSSNPMDFLSNTESQFKYLWYVYHNGSTEDFVIACAPIIIGAAIAHGVGGLAKTAFIKSEYASLRAGLSEEEALALANQAAKDAVRHNNTKQLVNDEMDGMKRPPGAPEPLTAPPRVNKDGTPVEPTAKEPVIPKVPTPPEESTFPKEHLAKPSEVKQNIDIVNNKIDGEAIDHGINKKLTAGTTAVVNQALNDMWQRVDQGLWAGLKIKMRIPYDLADMVNYSRVALTERLRQYAETVDVSPADLDLLTRAAQRTLDMRVNKFYQAGLDQMKAGKGYRAASAIGQAAVGASRSIFGAGSKVLDATDRFSRNEMWVGAQVASFLVNPQRDPEGWAAAQESSPSIGQALFDGTPLGSVTSGLVDAWAAWTSGFVPVGHLFSRVAGTGEALNLTTKGVDEALHSHIGYRAALKQMEGRTSGEVVQMFPELAKPAYKNGPPIINKLTETVDTGTRLGTKQVLGTPMQIHERFRALVVAEEYPTLAKLPTTSIYGRMRAAKIDGGPILGWFSRNLGQMPFAIDKDLNIVKNAIAYGDTAAIPAYARALRVGGMNQKEINNMCERLLANPTDQKLWQDTAQKALADMMGNRVLHHLVGSVGDISLGNLLKALKIDRKTLKKFEEGKIKLTPEQQADLNKWITEKEAILGPHEKALKKVHQAIDEQTRKLVGMSGEGPTGLYSFKRNADGTPGFIDNSRLINNQTAGGSFTQRGLLLMPSYKQIDKTMYEMMGQIIGDSDAMGKADYYIMRNVLEGSDWINNAFNNSFFKPLAIATGGWATRVSISEATLNTARLGPRNMLGGYATQNLINQQAKAYRIIQAKAAETGAARRARQSVIEEPMALDVPWFAPKGSSEEDIQRLIVENHNKIIEENASLKKDYEAEREYSRLLEGNNLQQAKKRADRKTAREERQAIAIANKRGWDIGVTGKLWGEWRRRIDTGTGKYAEAIRRGATEAEAIEQTQKYFPRYTADEIRTIDAFGQHIGTWMFNEGPFSGLKIDHISQLLNETNSRRAGVYDPVNNIINLFGAAMEHGIERTTIHETWHYLSHFISDKETSNFAAELNRARVKALNDNPLSKLIEEKPWLARNKAFNRLAEIKPKDMTAEDMHTLFNDLHYWQQAGSDAYRLRNVDEWFAEQLYDRSASRLASSSKIVEMGHKIISYMVAAINTVSGRLTSERVFNKFWNQRYNNAEWVDSSIRSRAMGLGQGVTEADMLEAHLLTPNGVTEALAKKGYTAPQSASREIALVVRGMLAGLDMTMLAGIGKADFVDAATELMFKHDGYLHSGVSAVHNGMASTVDLTAIDKVRKHGKKKGMPRTKLRRLGDNFTPVMFGNTGFYSGWQNMAQWISHDDILSRKAAGIYRDLRASGLRGDELRRVAIDETEKIIRDLPKSAQETMARSDAEHIGMTGEDPLHAWATERVDNLEYIVHGQRGKISLTEAEKEAGMKEAHFHEKLLNDIADANVPDSLDAFMRKYATNKNDNLLTASKLPHSTISREVADLKGTGNWTAMQRVAAFGHQKAFGPMVNHMVRQPLFIAEYAAVRKRLLPMVEDGTLSADQASVLAEIRATENMIPFIHNPLDKTKLEEMISVGYPFYFAQNQAWRRIGRLFAQDPGKFIQYYIAMSAVTNYVSEVKKNTGFSGVTIPLTMLLFSGIPLSGSTTSIGVIDPFQETSSDGEPQSILQKAVSMWGPHSGLVPTVAGHILLLDLPDAAKPLGWLGVSSDEQRRFAKNDWVVGPIGSSENLIDAAIPNSIVKNFKQMIIALSAGKPDQIATTGPFSAPSYVQAFSESMSAIMYENMTKEIADLKKQGYQGDQLRIILSTWTAQQFDPQASAGPAGYNKLMADARVRALGVLAGKTAIGAFSPLSVGVGDSNPQVRKFRDLLASDPKTGFRGATAKIWTEHPEYMAELMSRSGSVQGNYIPENAAVRKYIDSHTQFVRDNPLAAWAYGPDVTKDKDYSVPANQALIDVGVRKKIGPTEALDNFFIQLGWNTYYNDIVPFAEQRAKERNAAGSRQPKTGEPWTAGSIKSFYVDVLKKDNPQWGHARTQGKSAALEARTLNQLTSLMQKPEVNNTPALRKLNTHLNEFLNSPNGYATLAQYKDWEKKNMTVSGRLVDNDMVHSMWVDGVIPYWVEKYPDLAPALHTIFANFG